MTQYHHERTSSPGPINEKNATSPFYFVVAALLWTLTITALGYWHYDRVAAGFQATAISAARQSIEKDKVYRLWASEHGGVYVPTSPQTPSNPYLAHIPERDITTPSGRPLTLVNPAYMTRQVHELASKRFSSSAGKITSLNPVRPENRADAWETQALQRFSAGEREYSSLELIDGEKFLRVMAPFHAEAPCLRCHGSQGYQIGDLIGGIAVAIPWQHYQQAHQQAWVINVFGYGGVWILGLVLLEGHRRRLHLYLEQQRQSERLQRDLLERLQKSEERLSLGLNASKSGLWDWNLKTGSVYFDANYFTLSGYEPDEFPHDYIEWEKRVHPDDVDRAKAAIAAYLSRKSLEYYVEFRFRNKDGSWSWILEQGRVFEFDADDNPIRFLGAHTDITERKQAQLALEQKNQEMEQFVYSVSHDLKSPLVTVKTFVNILRQDLLKGDQQQSNDDLNYIDKAADKMGQLLDALVHYSRIGTVDAPTQTVSSDHQVHNCLATLAGILLQHQVQVSTGDLPHQLHGDPLHFGQIWQNLIENAVKYRGDQAQPHIEIGATKDGQDVVFYVRDNGMGIAPEHRERIFNLFSQLNPGSDGSGLGLALVKKIVSIYHGRIWVESAGEGQGSCFMFTLPGALKGQEVTE